MGYADELAAVVRLNNRYAAGVDGKDWDLLGSCFADDGRVADGWSAHLHGDAPPEELAWTQGPAAIIEKLKPWLIPYPVTQHMFGQPDVTFDGDEAEGWVYTLGVHVLPGTPGGDSCLVGVRYDDRLIRGGEGWVFKERVITALWTSGNATVMELPAR